MLGRNLKHDEIDLSENISPMFKKIMTTYSLNFDEAGIFLRLKQQIKKEFNYGKKNGPHFAELSRVLTKRKVMQMGKDAGLSKQEVSQVLPALEMKLIANKAKFALIARKHGVFKHPLELRAAVRESAENRASFNRK
tara:strand:- start:73 stop:483 length:411 start_codon:yes stop_codon:yes gene_type:complete